MVNSKIPTVNTASSTGREPFFVSRADSEKRPLLFPGGEKVLYADVFPILPLPQRLFSGNIGITISVY